MLVAQLLIFCFTSRFCFAVCCSSLRVCFCQFLGSVKGHFGPVNACAFSPTGKNFVSGAEGGYIRLHHFDQDYFKV